MDDFGSPTVSLDATPAIDAAALQTDGLGCHAGKERLRSAAEAAGLSARPA
ncbi:MAG: chitin-binding [Methylocystaceae bacterium]|nr:MAG: chitin-binding [Methylocystaceae bacterium]